MVTNSPAQDLFIGCDWGSTSFRVRLVESGSRRIVAEHVSSEGVKTFGGLAAETRAASMAQLLAERVAAWPQVPIVVTGMASANIGWCELPYAEAPFPLDGSQARAARVTVPAAAAAERTAWLVSGVRTADDAMRGEECALIGAHALRREFMAGESLCLLAGTHPKHARVRAGSLVDFCTFLTGELFEVLAKASLLAASVVVAAPEAEPHWGEFRSGVAMARERGLVAALFQVRARHVLHGQDGTRNAWFLSGLLIGAELERITPDERLLLIGEPLRQRLYLEALRELGVIGAQGDPETLSLTDCMIAGQETLLMRLEGEAAA